MSLARITQFFSAPVPAPERSLKKLGNILLLGIAASVFIFLYNPFGIANQAGQTLWIDILIFSLGPLFSISVIFMEWVVPILVPRAFQKWNIGKMVIWYTLVFLFVGAINFLYKSYLESFRDFTAIEFLYVLLRMMVISFTVSFFIIGITQILNRKKLTSFVSGEEFQIKSGDGKIIDMNLQDVLFVSSDDNYVDIHYLTNGSREKLILRSSLKNIEDQIVNTISPIIRCHRQFLINVDQFDIEKSTSRGMTLRLKDYPDLIPVSSKYVEVVKKQVSTRP